MSTLQRVTVYDDLLDLLSATADRERLLEFRLAPEKQERLDDLLDRNRAGSLSPDESDELEAFAHFEHVVRMLKARLLQRPRA